MADGIDVELFIDKVMFSDRKQFSKLQATEEKDRITVSNFGDFKSTIETFKKSLDNLKNAFDTVTYESTVTDEKIIKASITSNESVSQTRHQVNVTALAKPESLAANIAYPSRKDALGLDDGNLTFTIGAQSFGVIITSNDSLDTIRKKINDASSNIGVTANILATTNNGADEYTLVISSNKAGVDNKVTITGDSVADFDLTHELSVATNAEFTFDGKPVVRAENMINDVVDGITFSLLSLGQSDIVISDNTTNQSKAVGDAIKEMISSYNKVIDFMDSVTVNRTLVDNSVTEVRSKFRSEFGSIIKDLGNITSLSDMGIKLSASKEIPIPKIKTDDEDKKRQMQYNLSFRSIGKYEFDEKKFTSVLGKNIADIKAFFTDSTNGFIKKIDNISNKAISFDGIISSRVKVMNEGLSRLRRKIDHAEDRLKEMEDSYRLRYSKISAMISGKDNVSKILDAQMAGMKSSK